MLSAIFLVFAVVHLAVWLWGWRAWARNGRPRALFLILFGGTLLFYDNLRIGIGRFIGQGEFLQAIPDSVITVNLAGEPLATSLVDAIYAANNGGITQACLYITIGDSKHFSTG